MAYELRKITVVDQQKILKDAEIDQIKRKWLLTYNYFDTPDLTWAVDDAKNYYMFFAPRTMDESMFAIYYFYFEGKFYDLWTDFCSPGKITFKNKNQANSKDMKSLKEEITNAFLVYGHIGRGSVDGEKVNPIFDGNNNEAE